MYYYKIGSGNFYEIFDPEDILICLVVGFNQTQALLSHLNRE